MFWQDDEVVVVVVVPFFGLSATETDIEGASEGGDGEATFGVEENTGGEGDGGG